MRHLKKLWNQWKSIGSASVSRISLDVTSLIDTTSSGVFSTGATGAIAPVIFRKRPIAPVILPGIYPQG